MIVDYWMRLAMRVMPRALAVWRRVRALVSNWLVIVGLCAIAYGAVYWWKGLPYRNGMLLVCVALGCLPLGAGLYLRVPATRTTLALATVSLAVSGVTQLACLALAPIIPIGIVLPALAWAGAAHSYYRLRRLRGQA